MHGIVRRVPSAIQQLTAFTRTKCRRVAATLMQSAYAFSWQATVDQPKVTWFAGALQVSNYDDSANMTVDTAMHADSFITVLDRIDQLGQGIRHLATALPANRCRAGPVVDGRDHRERAVRRTVREEVDGCAVPLVRGHGQAMARWVRNSGRGHFVTETVCSKSGSNQGLAASGA